MIKGRSDKIVKEQRSYTTEETAKLLRVSKLTVYDLIKKDNYLPIVSEDKIELMQVIWKIILRTLKI